MFINKVKGLSFKEFNVIVPSVAASAGTLIALLADKILTTSIAVFSPVDPQFIGMTPHGPRVVSAIAYKKLIEETLPGLAKKQGLGVDNLAKLYVAQDMLLYQESLRALDYVEKVLDKYVRPKISDEKRYSELVNRLLKEVHTHGRPIHAGELRDAGLENIIVLDEDERYRKLINLIEEYYSYVQKSFLFTDGRPSAFYIIGSRYGEMVVSGGLKK